MDRDRDRDNDRERAMKMLEPSDLSGGRLFPTAQIKLSTSPTTSPIMSSPSSPTPSVVGPISPVINANSGGGGGGGGSIYMHSNPKAITGIPCVAAASRYTAPVHIDVGGTIYTSSLETLTRYDDLLARGNYLTISYFFVPQDIPNQDWPNCSMEAYR